MKKRNATLGFDENLQELENLVEKMEKGEFGLEDSLIQFERGINLTRSCQKTLTEAEQKIQVLLDKNNSQTLQPFSPDEHPNSNKESSTSD